MTTKYRRAMPLPTREDLLTKVDARYRERFPSAPARLDPKNDAHAEYVDGWYEIHREILSKLTDEAFFSFYPDAPERLDTSNPEHATYVEYWNDIAAQIDGRPGAYDWSKMTAQSPDTQEPIEMPVQDGSLQLEARIEYVHALMRGYAEAVGATTLGPKVLTHTTDQIESVRRLVRDGTFQTYEYWWRSLSLDETLYDEEDQTKEHAFVRNLTLEAKIDRSTGVLDLQLTGWARDVKRDTSFQRVSPIGD